MVTFTKAELRNLSRQERRNITQSTQAQVRPTPEPVQEVQVEEPVTISQPEKNLERDAYELAQKVINSKSAGAIFALEPSTTKDPYKQDVKQRAREIYYELRQQRTPYRLKQEFESSAKEAGLKPVYFKGEVAGYEDTATGMSYRAEEIDKIRPPTKGELYSGIGVTREQLAKKELIGDKTQLPEVYTESKERVNITTPKELRETIQRSAYTVKTPTLPVEKKGVFPRIEEETTKAIKYVGEKVIGPVDVRVNKPSLNRGLNLITVEPRRYSLNLLRSRSTQKETDSLSPQILRNTNLSQYQAKANTPIIINTMTTTSQSFQRSPANSILQSTTSNFLNFWSKPESKVIATVSGGTAADVGSYAIPYFGMARVISSGASIVERKIRKQPVAKSEYIGLALVGAGAVAGKTYKYFKKPIQTFFREEPSGEFVVLTNKKGARYFGEVTVPGAELVETNRFRMLLRRKPINRGKVQEDKLFQIESDYIKSNAKDFVVTVRKELPYSKSRERIKISDLTLVKPNRVIDSEGRVFTKASAGEQPLLRITEYSKKNIRDTMFPSKQSASYARSIRQKTMEEIAPGVYKESKNVFLEGSLVKVQGRKNPIQINSVIIKTKNIPGSKNIPRKVNINKLGIKPLEFKGNVPAADQSQKQVFKWLGKDEEAGEEIFNPVKIVPSSILKTRNPKIKESEATEINGLRIVGGTKSANSFYEGKNMYEQTSGGLAPPKSKSFLDVNNIVSVKPKDTLKSLDLSINKYKSREGLFDLDKLKVNSIENIKQNERQKQSDALRDRQQQKQTQALKQLARNLFRQRNKQVQRTKIKTPKILFPSSQEGESDFLKKIRPKLSTAYQVQIRRKGSFFDIGKPLPEGKALEFGTKKTKSSLAATFRLIEKGVTPERDISFKVPPRLFTAPKRPVGKIAFVERLGTRLSTRQEVSEILSSKRKSSRRLKWL